MPTEAMWSCANCGMVPNVGASMPSPPASIFTLPLLQPKSLPAMKLSALPNSALYPPSRKMHSSAGLSAACANAGLTRDMAAAPARPAAPLNSERRENEEDMGGSGRIRR
jgi:hypothetical protein